MDERFKYKFGKFDFSNDYYVLKKSKKVPIQSIDEIIKNAKKYSKKNTPSHFIQHLLTIVDENRNLKKEIFDSLKDDIFELSQDFYANYIIQDIISLNDEEKNDFIYNILINNDIVMLSFHTYGCRVLQKLIDYINKDKIKIILEKLKKDLKELFINQNGNRVIQKIIEKLNLDEIDDIYNEVLNNLNILIYNENAYGSFIIQAILKKIKDNETKKEIIIKDGETKREHLIKEIFNHNLDNLYKNKYNNHILKYIIENYNKYIEPVYQQIKGKINELSKDNYASYIIEMLLIKGKNELKEQILKDIIEVDKDKNENFNNDKCIEYIITHNYLTEEIIKDIIKRYKKNEPNIIIEKINFKFINNKLSDKTDISQDEQ